MDLDISALRTHRTREISEPLQRECQVAALFRRRASQKAPPSSAPNRCFVVDGKFCMYRTIRIGPVSTSVSNACVFLLHTSQDPSTMVTVPPRAYGTTCSRLSCSVD